MICCSRSVSAVHRRLDRHGDGPPQVVRRAHNRQEGQRIDPATFTFAGRLELAADDED